MLIALTRATPAAGFFAARTHRQLFAFHQRHFSSSTSHRRSLRGGPDLNFYEQIGRTNFQLVASHATARRCELDDVFEELADQFRDVRLALNQLSDRLLNLDDDVRPSLSL